MESSQLTSPETRLLPPRLEARALQGRSSAEFNAFSHFSRGFPQEDPCQHVKAGVLRAHHPADSDP